VFRGFGKRAVVLAAAVAACAVTVAVTATSASACALSSHCYGITHAPIGSSVQGSIATINTSALSVGNYCDGFASSELWLYTATGFIETGAIAGMHANGTCGSGDQWFWGEFSSNMPPNVGDGIYDQHFPGGSVGLNTGYAQRIQFVQGTTYQVLRNGNSIGYANYSTCCGTATDAGGEGAYGTFSDSGEASGLQKQISGSWSYGWTNAVAQNPQGAFSMSGTPSSDESWSH
jgi:hypothetical protein